MIKNKNSTVAFWPTFINTLSEITDKPAARDMLYTQAKDLHKKDIPDFKKQFIEHSRQISYKERKEYYTTKNVEKETINFLEEFSIEFALAGSYDIDKVFEYDKQFGKLYKWFWNSNKSWNLTKVWLYSLGRLNEEEAPFNILNTKEKLYLLELLADQGGLKVISGSTLLKKILPLITGINGSTLETNLKDYPNWFNARKKNVNTLSDRKKSLIHIKKEISLPSSNETIKAMIDKIDSDITNFDNEIVFKNKQ